MLLNSSVRANHGHKPKEYIMSRYIKITVEAGNGETVHQSTVFTQNFDTKEQQVAEQVPLFLAVADAVVRVMSEQK